MTVSVTTLFSVETAARILSTALEVAKVLGLPVTSWRVDDPTRVLFKVAAEVLGSRETMAAFFARSGFLSQSSGDWLTLLASEVYGVERTPATYAPTTVSLSNAGGWHDLAAGDVRFRSSVSGVTYTTTEAVSLHGPGATQTVAVIADVAGSDGSASLDEIDAFETTLLGVTITGSAVAVGVDEQGDDALKTQCMATLGALSPNGPPDAYEYVVRNADLTGSTEITRAASTAEGTDLTVTVYVAGASGAVSGAAVIAAQAAVDSWSTPLTATATVVAATPVLQAVTATVSGQDVPAAGELTTLASAALGALFSSVPIGGTLARSAIYAALHEALIDAGCTRPVIVLSVPAAELELDPDEVVTLGAVSVTEA